MRRHEFSVSGTPRIEVRHPTGDLEVLAGPAGIVDVELRGTDQAVERYRLEQDGDTIRIEPDRDRRIRWSSVQMVIRVGAPPRLQARLAAGDVEVRVDLASLTVETASGDVTAQGVAEDVTIRTATGDVRLGGVGGRLSVTTASGDVRVEAAASVDLKSATGDLWLGRLRGDASIGTASGDVAVARFEGDRLEAKSMAGDVTVAVAPGRRYEVGLSSLAGDIRSDFPVQGDSSGATARLQVKTVSGDIRIMPAEAHPAEH